MSFQRPTLTELVDRIQADFVSRLGLVGAVLRRSLVYVLARVLAGAAHMLHGHLEFLGKQLFPDLSAEEYLIRQAALYGIAKTSPGFAQASVVFTGTNGTHVPAVSSLSRSDSVQYVSGADVIVVTLTAWVISTVYALGVLRQNSGKIYLCTVAGTSAGSGGPTTTAAAIPDGSVTWMYIATGTAAVAGTATAVLAGAVETLTVGTVLTFVSPIAGIDSVTPVTSSTTNGSDQESTAALRVRLLERIAEPAMGGSDADWIAWAKTVAGVTRAWVTRFGLGPGTVLVRFVRDNDAGTIIPDAGEVAAVQAVFNLLGPAHATPTAFAPVLAPQAFTIAVTPNTTVVQAAVTAELTDLLLRTGTPGVTTLLSSLRTAVGTAAGVTNYVMTVPAADVTHTANEIPSVGAITWV